MIRFDRPIYDYQMARLLSHWRSGLRCHRSINSIKAIFWKVGRLASEEVILQLVENKCMSHQVYSTDW